MNIQSLSIVVPTGKCWNHCKFCVSHMHHEDYGKNLNFNEGIPESYINRMEYVRDEGTNSMIITGIAEPQQNLNFIFQLLEANKKLRKPFYNIGIQTTGTNFTEEMINKLANAGVTTLALSVSSFNDKQNWNIIQAPEKVRTMGLSQLVSTAKLYGMNVRLCINLTDVFNHYHPEEIFHICDTIGINDMESGVEQITFRKIYADGEGEEAIWVQNHLHDKNKFEDIKKYIKRFGIPIAILPYGYVQYSVHGISTVIDDNCMAKNEIESYKYAILRPNGKLYSRWDDSGSLIF